MNLNELFELQRKLDEHIVKEKGLEGQDLLPKKILSLQVELGELCNCWRGFKFWSNNREPRLKGYKEIKCKWCNGSGDDGSGVCPDCKCEGYVYKEYNPLLEEYIDVVHFALSIGLDIDIKQEIFPEPIKYGDVVLQFNELFGQISYFASVLNRENEWEEVEYEYERIWSLLFGLAGLLGFTWEQIEQAERALKNAEDLEDMDRQLLSEQKRIMELEEELKELRAIYSDINRERIRYKQTLKEIKVLAEYDEYENTLEQVYNCTKKALEETE